MKHILTVTALLALCSPGTAQDFSGTWQAPLDTRSVIKIIKTANGGYRGEYYDLGMGDPTAELISTIRTKNRSIAFTPDRERGTFKGEMAPDGQSLTGTWDDSGTPHPLTMKRAGPRDAWVLDASPHKVRFISVARDARLEVLDWGGSGPPLLFLPGWGNTAHVFDVLAPKFTTHHHVYGLTRRGFGLSSASAPTRENFDANSLADDVLAVMAALKLDRPVLIGHSVAGQELSSIGTRKPDKVAGLIYLDAAFAVAFYNPGGGGTAQLEIGAMREELEKLPRGYSESPAQIKKVLKLIPLLQKSLQLDLETVEGLPEHNAGLQPNYYDRVSDIMAASRRKFMGIKPPFLAIIASPRKCDSGCDAPTNKAYARELAQQAASVQADYPHARIIRIANSSHYVFNSNQAQVIREMNAFMNGLAH